MSQYEVDILLEAIIYADELHHAAPYTGLNPAQIDRRYTQWIIEYMHERGWRITRTEWEK